MYHSSKIFNFCDVMKKRESVFVKIKFKKKNREGGKKEAHNHLFFYKFFIN